MIDQEIKAEMKRTGSFRWEQISGNTSCFLFGESSFEKKLLTKMSAALITSAFNLH